MKLVATAILLLFAAPTAEIKFFRYERPLSDVPAQPAQACVVADAELLTHASMGLADVRLYQGRTEMPYLIQTSGPTGESSEQHIAALNLGVRGGKVVFDAAMPTGAYSDLQLNLSAQDFIATVSVAGSQAQGGAATKVGVYTIFDLTRQHLGRSTVLHLPTSDFRYLHFSIAGPLRAEEVSGVSLRQSSVSRPSYVEVAETSQVVQKGHSTVIDLSVPAHVPVDRLIFVAPDMPANFSRDVTISAAEVAAKPRDESALPPTSYTSTGNLLRVHTTEGDHTINLENLEVATVHTTFEGQSRWTITIDNGDNAPLLPRSVRAEMYERDLCFQSSPGVYALYYGDPALASPRYDIGQFTMIRPASAAQVKAGPEQQNPEFQERPDDRSFTEKHPALLWSALALVIGLLGLIALRTAKAQTPPTNNA